jgi:hypothetical protein
MVKSYRLQIRFLTHPMTLKEQLIQAIEDLPSDRLAEVLTFVKSVSKQPCITSAQSFLAHLKTIGTWSGDDLPECLEAIENSQGEVQFDYSLNPFD